MSARGWQPPQPPVDLPPGARHGSSYAHRRFKCRCGPCQAWRREYDSGRPPRGKNAPGGRRALDPEAGWYVCANRWGATFREHEYSRVGVCIRCGADRPTESHWERVWRSTS